MKMQLFTPFVNTKDLPSTLNFLSKEFPPVLKTKCFNDKNLPFIKEVQATELGHLFEHILLEQIFLMKSLNSSRDFQVNGRTSWNWGKDKSGIFHITVDAGFEDKLYVKESLVNSIHLTERLCKNHMT